MEKELRKIQDCILCQKSYKINGKKIKEYLLVNNKTIRKM